LEELTDEGNTNIWGGLEMGLENLRKYYKED